MTDYVLFVKILFWVYLAVAIANIYLGAKKADRPTKYDENTLLSGLLWLALAIYLIAK